MLALSPQWVRETLARALGLQDTASLAREWVRHQVLVPRFLGRNRGMLTRMVRLRRADGESLTVPTWVFSPRVPATGEVWAPVVEGDLEDDGEESGE